MRNFSQLGTPLDSPIFIWCNFLHEELPEIGLYRKFLFLKALAPPLQSVESSGGSRISQREVRQPITSILSAKAA